MPSATLGSRIGTGADERQGVRDLRNCYGSSADVHALSRRGANLHSKTRP